MQVETTCRQRGEAQLLQRRQAEQHRQGENLVDAAVERRVVEHAERRRLSASWKLHWMSLMIAGTQQLRPVENDGDGLRVAVRRRDAPWNAAFRRVKLVVVSVPNHCSPAVRGIEFGHIPRLPDFSGECSMKRPLASLVIASLLLITSAASAQQSASSGLVGQVTDSSQAAVPGATVTVTNAGTNAQRTTVTDGEGRFSVPALPPAAYHIKVELPGFQTAELQNFVLRQGETARPTITLGIATVSEALTVTGEAPLLQTQSASVGQVISEKQIEDLPLNGRTRAVAGIALGGRDPTKLRAQYPVRPPQSVHHRRRRARQLDQLHDRRRVRAIAAFQQPLAEPADRRRPGSQPASEFVLHRIRPGPGGGLHRHQVGHQPDARIGLRVLPRRSIRLEKFLRPDQARIQAQPVRRHRRRADHAQQVLRVRCLRRIAHHSGAAVSGQRAEPGVSVGQLLFPGDAGSRSSNRPAFPGQHHPGDAILTIRESPDSDDSCAEYRRCEQLHRHKELHRRRRYRDGSRRPDDEQQSQLVSAIHVLQRIAASACGVHVYRSAAARTKLRSRAYLGAFDQLGQRVPLRLQLRVPLERTDQSGRSQLDRGPWSGESCRIHVSSRVRPAERGDLGIFGARRRGQHAGRDREHLQRVERDQQNVRRPHAPIWSAGAVPQVRAPDRQLDTRKLHVQRHLYWQRGGRLPARLLLDVCRRVRRVRGDV